MEFDEERAGLLFALVMLVMLVCFIAGFYIGAKTQAGLAEEAKRTQSMEIGRVSRGD